MRYIRTKDGIYEAVKEQKNCFLISLKNIDEDCYDVPVVNKSDILKQADYIPELCDEFVYCDKDDKPYVIKDLELNKSFLKNRKQDKIYGAIWVKGEHEEPILKSVTKAKVLPNGEIDWELL